MYAGAETGDGRRLNSAFDEAQTTAQELGLRFGVVTFRPLLSFSLASVVDSSFHRWVGQVGTAFPHPARFRQIKHVASPSSSQSISRQAEERQERRYQDCEDCSREDFPLSYATISEGVYMSSLECLRPKNLPSVSDDLLLGMAGISVVVW